MGHLVKIPTKDASLRAKFCVLESNIISLNTPQALIKAGAPTSLANVGKNHQVSYGLCL